MYEQNGQDSTGDIYMIVLVMLYSGIASLVCLKKHHLPAGKWCLK